MKKVIDNQLTQSFYRGLIIFVALTVIYGFFRLVSGYRHLSDKVDSLQAQVDLLLRDSLRFTTVIPDYSDEDFSDNVNSSNVHDGKNDIHSASESHRLSIHTSKSNNESKASAQEKVTLSSSVANSSSGSVQSSFGQQTKFTTPQCFDLNTIDSLTLIRIPGIAGRTASVIIQYRTKIGGFYDPIQLGECLTWESAQEKLSMWCNSWFVADTARIRHIPINKLSFKALLSHPYLEYNQVKDIVNYRNRHSFVRLSDLRQLSTFSEKDIERLSHYLTFDE